jgi:hypothetical protein
MLIPANLDVDGRQKDDETWQQQIGERTARVQHVDTAASSNYSNWTNIELEYLRLSQGDQNEIF